MRGIPRLRRIGISSLFLGLALAPPANYPDIIAYSTVDRSQAAASGLPFISADRRVTPSKAAFRIFKHETGCLQTKRQHREGA